MLRVTHNQHHYDSSKSNYNSHCLFVLLRKQAGPRGTMQTKILGRTGLPVSIVGIGTAFLGLSNLNQHAAGYEELIATLDEERQESQRLLARGVERVERLVAQLLSLSRTERSSRPKPRNCATENCSSR